MSIKAVAVVFAVLLSLTLLLGILYAECSLPGLMTRRFSAFSQEELTQEAYWGIACDITAYLNGRQEQLPFFNAREQAHMQDVRQLVTYLRILLAACAAGTVLTGLPLIRTRPCRTIRRTLTGAACAAGLLMIWGAIDFQGLFLLFHKAAFTNDLWLLDPQTDRLIRLMPAGFFMAYALSVAFISLFCMLTAALLCRVAERRSGGVLRKQPLQSGTDKAAENDPDPGH
jgi:integral membrane protein (TIGR01906 family)